MPLFSAGCITAIILKIFLEILNASIGEWKDIFPFEPRLLLKGAYAKDNKAVRRT